MKKLSFIALSIALLLLSGCSSKDSSQSAPSEAPAGCHGSRRPQQFRRDA